MHSTENNKILSSAIREMMRVKNFLAKLTKSLTQLQNH